MRRRVKSKKSFTPSKQFAAQKIANENSVAKMKRTFREKAEKSDLSETFSPSEKEVQKGDTFSPQNIGIDLKKQAIPTQNIPIALPVPTISKLYIWTNILLCILYLILGIICSRILVPFYTLDQTSIPSILVVCLTLIAYVVYVLITIKCSSIRPFARKLIGIKEFESFFYEMKMARTCFRVELLGDRGKWSEKDEVREMVYEPRVVDQSGKFYPLPEVISYCDASSKNIKDREVSKYSEEQIVGKSESQNPAIEQPLITIVMAYYEKKYYFSDDSSKMNYLNSLQEFFHTNQQLFDPQKPIKGHKKMEFLVEGFEQKKAYLMVTLPRDKRKNLYKGQKIEDKSNDSLSQLKNDSFFMVNDPNSLMVLEDDEVKQKAQPLPEGLIYKHKKNVIFEDIGEQKVEPEKGQKPTTNETDTQYELEEKKYVRWFLVTYWIFLVLGLGAFYEWFVLKRYLKCIQVTITKQIHERLQSKEQLKSEQNVFKQ